MSKLLAWGVFAAAALGVVSAPARAVEQADIDGAIERGVAALRRLQGENGQWPHPKYGATALAALTLLECDAKADDKAVVRAADLLRRHSITMTDTYSIALTIFFFDRLGDPDDVPLIESLMVRLLAGQDIARGGWSYDCPAISQEEVKRLKAKVDERKELVGRRELPKPGAPRRKVEDLPTEIRQQLATLERGGGAANNPGSLPPDNSNTQFAALALWVGRRHGLPVEKALTRLDHRFRKSQLPDGTWMYMGEGFNPNIPMSPSDPTGGLGSAGSATMTCAGLLALAITDGATLELYRERKPDAKVPDFSKDEQLAKGLQALGAGIDNPKNLRLNQLVEMDIGKRVGGRTFYFLWSLERVAVALDLKTIGKKDWYGWGAEILLTNQQRDGSWAGEYAAGGPDTCFALLFLKRANLARDLTGQLKGKIKDPGERVIRAGGIGGGSLRGAPARVKSGVEGKDAGTIAKPLQAGTPDTEGGRLAAALLKAPAERQAALIEQMEKEKGTQYTEALAAAIPLLEGEAHRKARDALAQRLTRMKAAVLTAYLQDDDPEIRRAAALAVAMKESKELVPNLIPLLRDRELSVVRAAHAALKELTGQDFGPDAKANREERDKAALKWLKWLEKQKG